MLQRGIQPRAMTNRPLVQFKTLQDIAQEDAARAQQQEGQQLAPTTQSALAGHFRKEWETNKLFKEKISLRLLKCLRARRGVYSPAELAQLERTGGLNFVWVDLTETKCRAASAWIREVLLPAGDRPWQLDPSPMPDLPLEVKHQIVQKAAAQAQQAMMEMSESGAGVMGLDEFRKMAAEIGEELRDELEGEYKKRAAKIAERMSDKIADEQAQGDWEKAIDGFIEDFVTYPAAILEGPIFKRKRQLKWLPGFKAAVDETPRQCWARIDPFDFYPAPYATSPQEGTIVIRKRYQRRELFDCIGMPGYREEEIRKALRDYANGHLEGWLWTEAERTRLQQESLYTWLSPAGVIDALHCWGSVPGWMLMSWGLDLGADPDPEREYEVTAILCGTYVIYCEINANPMGWRPYYSASYDAVPGAFWGNSVPDLADTPQKMINAAACALADNMGMASGPQVWVHVDRLADGENSVEIFPWKMWQLKSDPLQHTNPGVGFFQPDDRSKALGETIDRWELKADDSTGIPRYTYGNERVGGAADTYSGLSMLMNNAAKGLRRAIGNVDINVIQPSVYYAYVNEMIYGKDEALKGDCVAVPRGAAALLVKEAQNQARLTALNIVASNPVLIQKVGDKGLSYLLRESMKALNLSPDDVVPTDAEQAKLAQQQQAAMQQQLEQQAQAEAMMAQAKEGAKGEVQMALANTNNESRERVAGAQIAAKLQGERDSANREDARTKFGADREDMRSREGADREDNREVYRNQLEDRRSQQSADREDARAREAAKQKAKQTEKA